MSWDRDIARHFQKQRCLVVCNLGSLWCQTSCWHQCLHVKGTSRPSCVFERRKGWNILGYQLCPEEQLQQSECSRTTRAAYKTSAWRRTSQSTGGQAARWGVSLWRQCNSRVRQQVSSGWRWSLRTAIKWVSSGWQWSRHMVIQRVSSR
jgi:hypothetical protein